MARKGRREEGDWAGTYVSYGLARASSQCEFGGGRPGKPGLGED